MFFLVYVNLGDKPTDIATIAFSFGGSSTIRNWEIKVSQIECTNPNRLNVFTGRS